VEFFTVVVRICKYNVRKEFTDRQQTADSRLKTTYCRIWRSWEDTCILRFSVPHCCDVHLLEIQIHC